jgi:hypothetical protein
MRKGGKSCQKTPAGFIAFPINAPENTMDEKRRGMVAVVAAAAPFWAGEAEVAQAYFSRPRTQDQDLAWLRAQAYKEARPFRDLPGNFQEEFLQTGAIRAHPDGSEAVQRMAQETRHFWLLADLIAELFKVKVTLADLVALPEDRKLQALRAAHKSQGGGLEQAAVAFTEGGGGAMFQVLSRLQGGEFEQQVAATFKVIADEEIPHGPMEIYAIARHAQNESGWQRARTIVRDISGQRLLMRNEMFGYPLSVARVREIAEGKIRPWPMPFPL